MLPFVQLLIALKEELVEALDGVTLADKPVTVRHHRHRESRPDEWPCVAIRFVSNDISADGRQTTDNGMPEQIWELSVDILIDVELPAEGDEGEIDLDPTGYATPAKLATCCLNHLFPGEGEPNTLGERAWDLRYDGTADDDDAQSEDYARMAERLVIVYRVDPTNPTFLLTGA